MTANPMLEVWKVHVDTELARLDLHRSRLDATEAARAARYRLDADRARFIIGRSTRKELLAHLMGTEWNALEFSCTEHGKPQLQPVSVTTPHFNSSHSGEWVLHAFADAPVGVDVELIRPEMAALDDFAWFLSRDERSFIEAAGDSQRAAALATVWVRKEAYVKALGEGLLRSLRDIGIVVGPDGKPAHAYDLNPLQDKRQWRIADLRIDEWHKGCVVHAGPHIEPMVRDYCA
jgi:4'-phosphopantetheinyl transferase